MSSRLPSNSIKIFGSLAFITSVPVAIIIFRDIAIPAKSDPIIASLIFYNISSSTRFGLPFFSSQC